ncbi:hypothetical protein D918_02760 [Trichuris suis]|nr:hypothetical protein D918_02760 [Trichuris suis]
MDALISLPHKHVPKFLMRLKALWNAHERSLKIRVFFTAWLKYFYPIRTIAKSADLDYISDFWLHFDRKMSSNMQSVRDGKLGHAILVASEIQAKQVAILRWNGKQRLPVVIVHLNSAFKGKKLCFKEVAIVGRLLPSKILQNGE